MAQQKATGTDVATSGNGSTGEIVAAFPMFRALLQKLELQATMDAQEDKTAHTSQMSAVEEILAAETEEEMWEADEKGPLGGRNLADVPQTIQAFTVKGSYDPEIDSPFTSEDGRQYYLLVTAVRHDTGEPMEWNTSAPRIVAKIMWKDAHGELPFDCVIRSTKLSGARAVLKLKALNAPSRVSADVL